MTFQFRPAVRERTPLLIGLAGPSGSGKTFSALRLATGLAAGGSVFFVDTESRRGLHYADQFRFQHCDLTAPFRPSSYLDAMVAAKAAGAVVVIVDSMSHEHEGPGGILEWHDEEVNRMAGDNATEKRREAVKFAAWIKPKAEHNRFVNSTLQLGIHCIFCFRAKEKISLVKVEKTNDQTQRTYTVTEVVPQGWQPICSDRFEYEMTALLMLPPNSGGVPDLKAGATKLQEQHRAMLPAGERLGEEIGRRLAEWAAGGAMTSNGNGHAAVDWLALAKVEARKGADAFKAFWNGPAKANRGIGRTALQAHLAELQAIVRGEPEPADEDPLVGEQAAAAPSHDAETGEVLPFKIVGATGVHMSEHDTPADYATALRRMASQTADPNALAQIEDYNAPQWSRADFPADVADALRDDFKQWGENLKAAKGGKKPAQKELV